MKFSDFKIGELYLCNRPRWGHNWETIDGDDIDFDADDPHLVIKKLTFKQSGQGEKSILVVVRDRLVSIPISTAETYLFPYSDDGDSSW